MPGLERYAGDLRNRFRPVRAMLATAVGTVLAAIAGALPGAHLATMTAATMVAAAFASHIAATQHQRTTRSPQPVQPLIPGVGSAAAGASRQAESIADAERVLAAQ